MSVILETYAPFHPAKCSAWTVNKTPHQMRKCSALDPPCAAAYSRYCFFGRLSEIRVSIWGCFPARLVARARNDIKPEVTSAPRVKSARIAHDHENESLILLLIPEDI